MEWYWLTSLNQSRPLQLYDKIDDFVYDHDSKIIPEQARGTLKTALIVKFYNSIVKKLLSSVGFSRLVFGVSAIKYLVSSVVFTAPRIC